MAFVWRPIAGLATCEFSAFSRISTGFSCFSFRSFTRVPWPSRASVSLHKLKYAVNRKLFLKCNHHTDDLTIPRKKNHHKFLTESELFAALHDLSDYQDKRILAAFHLHLRGPAVTCYNSLSEENRSNWVSVKILFKGKFINFSGHGATFLMHSNKLQNLILSPGQSVNDFFCKIY